MKVLHISNNFYDSKVHMNLYAALDRIGVNQLIYSYFSNKTDINKNKFDAIQTEFIYSAILNKYNRLYYPYKEHIVYRDMKRNIDLKQFNLTHATTLFSDGGLSYKIYKEYGTPYIVAVRNTDLCSFMRIPLYWKYGRDILINAQKVIFITNSLKNKFLSHMMVKPIISEIESKLVVIENGIDSFWLDNICRVNKSINHSICYVGRFQKRKNVPMLIKAVEKLAVKYPDIRLDIIGAGDEEEAKVKRMAQTSCYINFVGPLYDKNKIREYFHKCSVFAMPSVDETYGLVYVEALTQNMTLLYTKNDGIDGTFLYNIGEAITPSVNNVVEGIERIFGNPRKYSGNKYIDFSKFNWDNIAERYMELYREIIN